MPASDYPPGELPRATPIRSRRWQAVAELIESSSVPVRRTCVKALLGSGRSHMTATLDQLCKAHLIHIEEGVITLTERGKARLLGENSNDQSRPDSARPICIRASIRD